MLLPTVWSALHHQPLIKTWPQLPLIKPLIKTWLQLPLSARRVLCSTASFFAIPDWDLTDFFFLVTLLKYWYNHARSVFCKGHSHWKRLPDPWQDHSMMGLERWFSSLVRRPQLFRKTQIWFPVPTWWLTTLYITSSRGSNMLLRPLQAPGHNGVHLEM